MNGVPNYLVDSNILLRYLIGDDPAKAAAARKLIDQARKGTVMVDVPFVAVSETAHTLRSFYGLERSEIARELLAFLKAGGVRLSAPSWLLSALADCETKRVSFGDACIAAEARATGKVIASFDTDFDSFEGVVRFEPK